jgi:hypothetical protein
VAFNLKSFDSRVVLFEAEVRQKILRCIVESKIFCPSFWVEEYSRYGRYDRGGNLVLHGSLHVLRAFDGKMGTERGFLSDFQRCGELAVAPVRPLVSVVLCEKQFAKNPVISCDSNPPISPVLGHACDLNSVVIFWMKWAYLRPINRTR